MLIVLGIIIGCVIFVSINFVRTKSFIYAFLALTLFATFAIVLIKPVMHKTFSVNVIDYLVKFNKDGSVSTVKTTSMTQVITKDVK